MVVFYQTGRQFKDIARFKTTTTTTTYKPELKSFLAANGRHTK